MALSTISTREAASRQATQDPAPLSSRALAKGLRILELLASASQPLSLADLAIGLRLGKPSTLRLLQTLSALDYVRKDDDGNYRRGLLPPGSPGTQWTERLLVLASEEILELNHDLAETVSLAALFGDHVRVIHTLESSQHIRMSNFPNRILPPYASSLGKAITAFQPPESVQQLIQVFGVYQITANTLTDPVRIREDLARVREQGYATEIEETVLGGCCVGAPIQERDGTVRAALSVSLPFSRFTGRMRQLIPKRVAQAAKNVAKKLSR
jgi:IclR family acetate operon transcriptional repressor